MSETREQRDARMKWWREARFGMFIHWGVYSAPVHFHKSLPIELLYLALFLFKALFQEKWVGIANITGCSVVCSTKIRTTFDANRGTSIDTIAFCPVEYLFVGIEGNTLMLSERTQNWPF